MTYYRKQRMESFKKAMFASRFSDKHLRPSLPQQPRATAPADAPGISLPEFLKYPE